MKYNFIRTLSFLLLAFSFFQSCGQEVQKIKLAQTPGAFVTQDLALTPGDYQFEIAN